MQWATYVYFPPEGISQECKDGHCIQGVLLKTAEKPETRTQQLLLDAAATWPASPELLREQQSRLPKED